MWIKLEKLKKGKKIVELGEKRSPGDPLYEVLNNLYIAINNLKEECIIYLKGII